MNKVFAKCIAPVATLAMGVGLSGCDMNISVGGGDGVPLAELDMTGAAPDSLTVAVPDKVILTEGETLDIVVEGDGDAAESLRFDLDGNDLGIYRDDGWNSNGSATIRVTMSAPREINIGGSGDVEAPVMADSASINIGGSGNVAVAEFAASTLEVNIGGSGTIDGAGSAERLEVVIGGNGNVNLADLTTDRAEVTIGGSGDVAFASDGDVEATIGGSGTVNVTGDAKCELNSFGSGTLNCAPRSAEAADASTEETPQDEADES
ncbi:MAG: head GIN domain-containing protein [Pseudomonadota bacterium]